MTYQELLKRQPLLLSYAEDIPKGVDDEFIIRKFPPHSTICCKGDSLSRVGILLSGSVRILNEFENGYTYVIETQTPIAFIGTIGCLAHTDMTTARCETVTECELAYTSAANFKRWLQSDINFLWAVSAKLARTFYEQVYQKTEHLFLPTIYILFKYILSEAERAPVCSTSAFILEKPRRLISEELGIPIKTINRTVSALVQDGAVFITRGKISLTYAQYISGSDRLRDYSRRSRNGKNTDVAAPAP